MGPRAEAAIPALIKALGDEHLDVRVAAAKALGRIGEAAIPALIEALAAEALGWIGPKAEAAIPVLIEKLKDENIKVQKEAAQTIKKISPHTPPSPGSKNSQVA
jgi:HEAT repeat protein